MSAGTNEMAAREGIRERDKRIAELEAERDKLHEVCQSFVDVLEAERLTATVPIPRKVESLWIEAERLAKEALGHD